MFQQRGAPLPRTTVTTSTAVGVSPTTTTANNVHQRSSPATSSRRGPTVSAIVSYGAAAAAFHTLRVSEMTPLSKQKKVLSHDASVETESFAVVSPVEYAAALVEQLSLNGVSSRFPHHGLPSNTKYRLGKACSSTLSWSIQQDGLSSSSFLLPAPLSRSQLSDRSSAPASTAVLSPNGWGLASVLDNIGGSDGQPAAASVPPSSTLSLYIPVIDASALNAEESLMPELLTYLRRAAANEEVMLIPVLLVDTSTSSSSAERYSREALEVVAALRENCFVVDAVLLPPTATTSQSSTISSHKRLELLSPDDVALKIMYLLDELRQVGEEADDRESNGRVQFEEVPGQKLARSVTSSHAAARGIKDPPSAWSINQRDSYNLLCFESLEDNNYKEEETPKIQQTSSHIEDSVTTDVSLHDVLVRDLRGFSTARNLDAAFRAHDGICASSSGSSPSGFPLAAAGITRTLSPPLSPEGKGPQSIGSGSSTTSTTSCNVKLNSGLVRRLEEALTAAASAASVGATYRAGPGHLAAQAQGRSCLYEKPTATTRRIHNNDVSSTRQDISSSSLYALVEKHPTKTSSNQTIHGRGSVSSSKMKTNPEPKNAVEGRFPYAFTPLSQTRRMTLLHVTQLDFSNLFLGDLGVSSLCVTFLPYLVPRLRELNLDGNGISERGIRWLIGNKRTHGISQLSSLVPDDSSQFSERLSGGGIAGHPSLETLFLRDNRLNQPAIVMLCGFVSALSGTAGASLTAIDVEANPFNFSTHWCGQLDNLLSKRREKVATTLRHEEGDMRQGGLQPSCPAVYPAHRLTLSWTVSCEFGGAWCARVTISTRGDSSGEGGRHFTEDVTFGPMALSSSSPPQNHQQQFTDTFAESLKMICLFLNIPNHKEEKYHAQYRINETQHEKATGSFFETQCLTVRRAGCGGSFRLLLIGSDGQGLEGLTQATLSSLIAACKASKNNTNHPTAVVEHMRNGKHRLLYNLLQIAGKSVSSSTVLDVAAKLVFEPPFVAVDNNIKTPVGQNNNGLAASVSTPFTPRSPFFLQATFRLSTFTTGVEKRSTQQHNQSVEGEGCDVAVVSLRRSVVQYMTSQVLSFVGCLHDEILLACSQLQ